MRGRHITTAVTLLVLVGLLVLAGMYGVKAMLAPVPSSQPAPSASPDCETVKKGTRIRAAEVTVSVFNAGTRSGLADDTMGRLRKRGFTRGDIGNAPSDVKVSKVQVWSTRANDTAAQLVALQFGGATKVRVVDTDLGPGVDVVVGDSFSKLAKARTTIVTTRTTAVCRPSAAPSSAGS